MGVQLYTLRRECADDFLGTLEAVASVGYRWVELFGFFDVAPCDLILRMKDLGIGAISSHVSLDLLESDLEATIEAHKEIECTDIVCPWLEEERRRGPEAFEKVGRTLDAIGRKLNARGFRLSYHNHDFEFGEGRVPDGLQQILGEASAENLSVQPDVYWLSHAGLDPVDYVRRLGSRVKLIHLKDGRPGQGTFTPVGRGEIDMAKIIGVGRELGVKAFIVEQDECELPPLESIAVSLDFLRKQGLGE